MNGDSAQGQLKSSYRVCVCMFGAGFVAANDREKKNNNT